MHPKQTDLGVIVAQGPAAALAAQRVTRTIPIVAAGNHLVALGLIDSIARPGRNITGVSLLIRELDAKRPEVLKEILPAARRVGLLIDPAIIEPFRLTDDRRYRAGARRRGSDRRRTQPYRLPARHLEGAEGVNVLSSPLLFHFREELGALLLAHKLPAICEWSEMVASACLASYGTTLRELYATEAALAHKMLKGASPADTPGAAADQVIDGDNLFLKRFAAIGCG